MTNFATDYVPTNVSRCSYQNVPVVFIFYYRSWRRTYCCHLSRVRLKRDTRELNHSAIWKSNSESKINVPYILLHLCIGYRCVFHCVLIHIYTISKLWTSVVGCGKPVRVMHIPVDAVSHSVLDSLVNNNERCGQLHVHVRKCKRTWIQYARGAWNFKDFFFGRQYGLICGRRRG